VIDSFSFLLLIPYYPFCFSFFLFLIFFAVDFLDFDFFVNLFLVGSGVGFFVVGDTVGDTVGDAEGSSVSPFVVQNAPV